MGVVEWEVGYVTDDKPLQVPVELTGEQNLTKVKEAVGKIKDSRDVLENLSGDAGSVEKLEICESSISECQEAIQSVRNDVHAQSGKQTRLILKLVLCCSVFCSIIEVCGWLKGICIVL